MSDVYKCADCNMRVVASEFHPHLYCVLYKAGIREPERYMRLTMPTLTEHFPESVALLRRVLGEYVQGNQIIDGYWYSPDETGAPHYRNQAATADEMSLWLSLAEEVGL